MALAKIYLDNENDPVFFNTEEVEAYEPAGGQDMNTKIRLKSGKVYTAKNFDIAKVFTAISYYDKDGAVDLTQFQDFT